MMGKLNERSEKFSRGKMKMVKGRLVVLGFRLRRCCKRIKANFRAEKYSIAVPTYMYIYIYIYIYTNKCTNFICPKKDQII